MKLHIDIEASDDAARTGTVRTARGSFVTPVFMPVGTRGTVRALTTADLEHLGAEVVLANAYHLMLRPGAEVVAALGGVGRFADWHGHTLTDSGGYQIFSLGARVDDDGVVFRSTYDGSTHRVTPEDAVHVQEQLGADIQMALDVCSTLPASRHDLQVAVERTAAWAGRARVAHRRRDDQSMFGIVQGGTEVDLRVESAERTVACDFDGYAIGGLSVGESRESMLTALDATVVRLPVDQPRYLMGVGDPIGIIEAVARGVDMMDCVLPTRLARHGTLLTSTGRLSIKRAEFARSDDPIDAQCGCDACARYSRGYLRHLAVLNEPSAASILTQHNLSWMLQFMGQIRAAIRSATLGNLRAQVAAVWR